MDKRRNTGEQGCRSRRRLLQLMLQIKEECMCPICIAALSHRSGQLPGAKLVRHIIPSMLKAIAGSYSTPAVLLMPGLAGEERARDQNTSSVQEGRCLTTEAPAVDVLEPVPH